MIQIAVLGFGTVGSGVAEVLCKNQETIRKKAGEEIHIKYVLDQKKFPGKPVEKFLVKEAAPILEDPEVSVLVETMGGIEPAFSIVRKALESGKSVCTANKELVATHGTELLLLAKEHRVNFLFEAACGGGIPMIGPLNASLSADEVDEITGILNGTTNYILSRMAEDGWGFSDALKEACRLGFAERDSATDVEGIDACRKLAILSSLAFGGEVDDRVIPVEGIAGITPEDIKYATSMGTVIKLLATSRKKGERYEAMVSPVMIDKENPLFSIRGLDNAVVVHGKVAGNYLFSGKGAGKYPAACAVLGDVITCVRNPHRTVLLPWSRERICLCPAGEMSNRFFVRVSGNAAEKKAEIEEAFGPSDFVAVPSLLGEFAFITGELAEKEFHQKISRMEGVLHVIRARF